MESLEQDILEFKEKKKSFEFESSIFHLLAVWIFK